MADKSEILEKVSEILEEALGADEDDITPEAELFADLDAESIDLLDITFQLEKAFDIQIPRAELFPGPADLGDEDGLVEEGQLTDAGMARLKEKLPHAEHSKLGANPKIEQVQKLYTVQMIVNYIDSRL